MVSIQEGDQQEKHTNVHYDFFFFNDTATTEIYTLSLHDALPIYPRVARPGVHHVGPSADGGPPHHRRDPARSEEHTSELQSRSDLVCRLLLEKKKRFMNDWEAFTKVISRRNILSHITIQLTLSTL